jgi:hypothetical protein
MYEVFISTNVCDSDNTKEELDEWIKIISQNWQFLCTNSTFNYKHVKKLYSELWPLTKRNISHLIDVYNLMKDCNCFHWNFDKKQIFKWCVMILVLKSCFHVEDMISYKRKLWKVSVANQENIWVSDIFTVKTITILH